MPGDAAERGVGCVDAAILSGVEQVRDGTSAFLLGGEPTEAARKHSALAEDAAR